MNFFGRDTLLALVIASLVVPLQMSLIPLLSIYNDIGSIMGVGAKSYPGVWMAHTGFGLASTTFLLRNFLKSLPSEMMEAAKVDGGKYYTHTVVKDTKQKEDGSWNVVTDKGNINAEIVINAGGLWAREVGKLAGINLPVQLNW